MHHDQQQRHLDTNFFRTLHSRAPTNGPRTGPRSGPCTPRRSAATQTPPGWTVGSWRASLCISVELWLSFPLVAGKRPHDGTPPRGFAEAGMCEVIEIPVARMMRAPPVSLCPHSETARTTAGRERAPGSRQASSASSHFQTARTELEASLRRLLHARSLPNPPSLEFRALCTLRHIDDKRDTHHHPPASCSAGSAGRSAPR